MLNERLQLSWQDILSIIFTGLATATGMSFSFLPTPLPGPLSRLILAGFAVFLTSIAALLQASKVGEPPQNNQREPQVDTIELPRRTYQQQLDQSYNSGYYEGRYDGIQESQEVINSSPDENMSETSQKGSEVHENEILPSNLENEINALKSELNAIKEQNSSGTNNSVQSQIDEIESQIESIEGEVENLQSRTVSNFELVEKENELKEKIKDNKHYIHTVYQIIKDNVDDFEPPSQENSDPRNTLEEAGSSSADEIEKDIE